MSGTAHPDHYALLGVPRDAAADDVRAALRRRARQYHPDLHTLAPEPVRAEAGRRSAALDEAHRVLTSADLRARYDRALDRARATAWPADRGGADHLDRFMTGYVPLLRRACAEAGMPQAASVVVFDHALEAHPVAAALLPPQTPDDLRSTALAHQITKAGFRAVPPGGRIFRAARMGAASWPLADHFTAPLSVHFRWVLDVQVPRPDLPRDPGPRPGARRPPAAAPARRGAVRRGGPRTRSWTGGT